MTVTNNRFKKPPFAMKFILLASILSVAFAASANKYKSYKDHKVYHVSGDFENIYRFNEDLLKYNEAIITENIKDGLQVLVAPQIDKVFQEAAEVKKLTTELIYDDFSIIIAQEKAAMYKKKRNEFSWDAYYDVDGINAFLQNMTKTFPDSTKLVVGGQSYEGRQILGLRILTTNGAKIEKPAVFIESGIHAREWITPATTTYFINQLLTSDNPEIQALRDQFDWHIFPTVNPDGYHYTHTFDRMWRKTRSVSPNGCIGADPNRNWDHNWRQHSASSDPCNYQLYAGSRPFSEIETRTLSEYISNIEDLIAYIGFHSDAQMLLVPYSDSTEHEGNYDDLIQIGKTSLQYGYKVNQEEYDGPATAAEILYKASGGSMDWVREALGTQLVYTYELRGRYFHWPPSRIPEQGKEVTQMMLGLFTEANNLGYF